MKQIITYLESLYSRILRKSCNFEAIKFLTLYIFDSWNQWVIMLKMYFSLGGSDVQFARWGEENPSGIILTFNENFSDRNDSFLSNHLLMLMTSWCLDLTFATIFGCWWKNSDLGYIVWMLVPGAYVKI